MFFASIRRFLTTQPLPIRQFFTARRDPDPDSDPENEDSSNRHRRAILPDNDVDVVSPDDDDVVSCDWNIRTDPNLYLLVTFHNLSAPTTVRCSGAYIEVEREANGYEARWCGNRLTTVILLKY